MTTSYLDSKRISGLSTDVLETPTLDYGFPDSTNWNVEGSTGRMTISGGILSYDAGTSSLDGRQWYPLGFAITGNFIMDFKLTQQTCVNCSVGQAVNIRVGLSNANSGVSGEVPIGQNIQYAVSSFSTGATGYATGYGGDGSNYSYDYKVESGVWNTVNSSALIRYGRIARTGSSVTFKVYSNGGRTSQLGTTITLTNSNTFNYLFLKVFTQASSTAWNFDIDDIKIYNGVTSLTSKPDSTTVQTGSIFTETDTGIIKWASNNWGL